MPPLPGRFAEILPIRPAKTGIPKGRFPDLVYFGALPTDTSAEKAVCDAYYPLLTSVAFSVNFFAKKDD